MTTPPITSTAATVDRLDLALAVATLAVLEVVHAEAQAGPLPRPETGERPVTPWQARRLVKQADQLIQDASRLGDGSTLPTSTICS